MRNKPKKVQAWAQFEGSYFVLWLLYFGYFKPFSLQARLNTIHPELELESNPFQTLRKDPKNRSLQDYANRVWWLTFLFPIIFVVAARIPSLFIDFISKDSYLNQIGLLLLGWATHNRLLLSAWTVINFNFFTDNYFNSTNLFLFGWTIGLILVRQGWSQRSLFLILIALIATNHGLQLFLTGDFDRVVASLGSGMLLGLVCGTYTSALVGWVLGISFGVVFSMTLIIGMSVFGVASDITAKVSTGTFLGVAVGVTFHMLLNFIFRVSLGTAFRLSVIAGLMVIGLIIGTVIGIEIDMASGVVFFVGYTLALFRIYIDFFWIIWSIILDRSTTNKSVTKFIDYLPHRLDENIYLPLPFIDRILVRLYLESKKSGRDELEYLLKFTNQEKLAHRVMTALAIKRLVNCQNTQDIDAISREISWIPERQSESGIRLNTPYKFYSLNSYILNGILSTFLDLASDIRASGAATSPYRQQQNLELPKQALENLKTKIALVSDRSLRSDLLLAVRQWQQAIQDLQDRLSEAAQRTGEIPNPYSPNASLIDTAAVQQFRGRRDVFQELENLAQASSPPMLLLWGNRRMGKSWALNYLPRCLNSEIVPLRVDLQGSAGSASSLAGFARNLAQDITRAADQARNLRLPPPNAQALKDDPFSELQHWFSEIERGYPDLRFWLCLDEYERLEALIKATDSHAPLNFFRYIFQNRRAWTLLFCGSHDPSELDPYWSDYLINTRTVKVSYLSEADSRDLITKPEPQRDFPEIYDPAAIDRIWHWTAGHPYWTQNLCFEVVQLLNREQRRRATVDDVDRALDRATESGSAILREFWDNSLTASQRAALTQLLTQQPLRPEDDRPLQKLLHKEILRPDPSSPSGYRLWVPLYHHHLTTAQPWRDRP